MDRPGHVVDLLRFLIRRMDEGLESSDAPVERTLAASGLLDSASVA